MSRLRADALLLLTALIWGSTFVVQKSAVGDVGPWTFVGSRFFLATLALAPIAWIEARRGAIALERESWGLAGLCGLCLCFGAYGQQAGMATASATNAGFLTALYVVIVPFMVWALSRRRPHANVFIASVVSVAGAWMLTGGGPLGTLSAGDVEIVASDIAWALGMTLTPMFLARSPRPFLLCLIQNAIAAAIGLAAAGGFETVFLSGLAASAPSLLYAGFLSSAVGFTFQVVAQGFAPPAEAALILSLEAVFAAVCGALWLGERLTLTEMGGCALILSGVVLVEFGPALSRMRV